MPRKPRTSWHRLAGERHIARRSLDAWRVVEGQHLISTRKLVDTLEEQEVLEELIDGVKPALRLPGHLHFLLSTPFRYPPLHRGSRFGRPHERGIWYGALELGTAFAERAYYRLLFLDGGPELGTISLQETAFRAAIATDRFVDLAAPPFAAHEAEISSPTSYQTSQELGTAMRDAGVEVFTYVAARARGRALAVALFEPAFASSQPFDIQTWTCTASRAVVELRHIVHGVQVFPRTTFLVGGALPHPAV